MTEDENRDETTETPENEAEVVSPAAPATRDEAPAPAQIGRKVLAAVSGRDVPVERTGTTAGGLREWPCNRS